MITIITDIPVWVRPLVRALKQAGARVAVATEAGAVAKTGLIVNRLSTGLAAHDPARADELEAALRGWAREGRTVVNGADCFRLGYNKLAQADLFRRCGAKTPKTCAAVPGGRALPDRAVFLKPSAGGFGRGILELAPGENTPLDLFVENSAWVEQERCISSDGSVHRIEILGQTVLYDAQSPLIQGEYNYCLANAETEVVLREEKELPSSIVLATLRIAREGDMELGALEYLLDTEGTPVFIDFNPVSSLHPHASKWLPSDPVKLTADYLIKRAEAIDEINC